VIPDRGGVSRAKAAEEEGPGTGSLLETGIFAEVRHFFIEDPGRLTVQDAPPASFS